MLKDVSATAIYGSRGANGVIIVTTKKGKRNQTNIKYQYQLTYATPSKKLSVLNATEWARYQKQYFYNKGNGYIWTPDTLELICSVNDNDPEWIGKQLLEMREKLRNEHVIHMTSDKHKNYM